MQNTYGVDEMLGEPRWIKPSHVGWESVQQRSLRLRNHTQSG
jgi:hypothetical protein